MKVKKITKKLTLNKLTVASLEPREQQVVRGGYLYTKLDGGAVCRTWDPYCPTLPQPICIY